MKAPNEVLDSHKGGFIGPKAAAALSDLLAVNTTIRRLDLSRNVKLTGAGLVALSKGMMDASKSALLVGGGGG